MSLSTPSLTTSPEISATADVVSARTAANAVTEMAFMCIPFGGRGCQPPPSRCRGPLPPPWTRGRAGAEPEFASSHPEILVQLVEVLRKIRVADHVDDAAVLDDVMAIGESGGETKILLDEKNRQAFLLK